MARAVVVALALAVLLIGVTRAYEPTLDADAVAEALALGQSRIESVRLRFHQPYRLSVSRAPVDYLEIVTPFRRLVLVSEERARVGDRSFGQREALALLDARRTLEIRVELTFHPLNTYLGVPPYQVSVTGSTPRHQIPPRSLDRVPRYGARLEGMPLPYPYPAAPPVITGSQPMLGGTLVADFDHAQLNPTEAYDVVVTEGGKEVAGTRMDLAKIR